MFYFWWVQVEYRALDRLTLNTASLEVHSAQQSISSLHLKKTHIIGRVALVAITWTISLVSDLFMSSHYSTFDDQTPVHFQNIARFSNAL